MKWGYFGSELSKKYCSSLLTKQSTIDMESTYPELCIETPPIDSAVLNLRCAICEHVRKPRLGGLTMVSGAEYVIKII